MTDATEQESRDGVRISWNHFPSSKLEQQRLLLPLGVLYTPLKQVKDPTQAVTITNADGSQSVTPPPNGAKLVAYEPVRCRGMGMGKGSGSNSGQLACNAVLNPFCSLDLQSKTWTCVICGYRNQLSQYYADNITEVQLPPEKQSTTIEYLLPNPVGQQVNQNQNHDPSQSNPNEPDPPVFLFVLDTALNNPEDESEFQVAKESLQQILQLMPSNSLVGFVSYGALINVHELGCTEMSKSYAFRGTKAVSAQQVGQQLGLPPLRLATSAAGNNQNQVAGPTNPLASQELRRRFLLPISECEFTLNSILDELCRDRWPQQQGDKRTGRCTGAALSVAIGIVENLAAGKNESQISGGRVILLSSGPTTLGPGTIVSLEKSEVMRSHQDLQKERANARHSKPAISFYASLAARLVQSGYACDIFASSLDQIGSYEMRVLPDRTGGVLVMSDGFSTNVFKDSFSKLFSKTDDSGFLAMGFNAKINTLCSKELKISGAIGACCSTQNGKEPNGGPKKNPHHHMIGEAEVGEANTTQWKIGVLDMQSTIAFFLEISDLNGGGGSDISGAQGNGYGGGGGSYGGGFPGHQQKYAFLQFQTLYHHPSGARRLRVTTITRPMTNDGNQLASGFDQEAQACLITRNTMAQIENGIEEQDCVRRLDRVLIRVISRFASYNKDDIGSFFLPESFTFFPSFIYYLRRSQYIDTFNASPDETAFYRSAMNREICTDSLVMIQPALLEYSLNSVTSVANTSDDSSETLQYDANGQPITKQKQCEPVPVLLDASSMKKDVILLMDSFFHIVIWKGATIQSWIDQGFPELPEYEHLKVLIEQPELDAVDILKDRFPVPKFIKTTEGGSQARFMLARVNPSRTHTTSDAETNGYNTGGKESSMVLTEDASLKTFMQALIKAAVSS